MLVNNNMNHVVFIEYTGKYPNLCRGVLTLQIDGIIYKFGHNSFEYDCKTDTFKDEDISNPNFDKFWCSGGSTGFTNDYTDSYVTNGEWVIDVSNIPAQFQKYASEIDMVFNSNVTHGCCGGCL